MGNYKPYCKPHLKMIIDKAKDYIPKGDFCDEPTMFGVHCPFFTI